MANATVIALHCSLGSGRQWTRLAESPISHAKIINPDIVSHDELAGDFSRVLLTTRPEAIEDRHLRKLSR
jgi:hypothetical protein